MNIPEGEVKKGTEKKIFEEILVKTFLSLMKDLQLCIEEAQQIPNKIKIEKKPTLIHIIIKLLKVKEKILKPMREK